MTDPAERQESALASAIEDVVTNMTRKQFDALSERTGHVEPDPKQAAAQALADLVSHGNINANQLTTDQLAAKLHRHGFGT